MPQLKMECRTLKDLENILMELKSHFPIDTPLRMPTVAGQKKYNQCLELVTMSGNIHFQNYAEEEMD